MAFDDEAFEQNAFCILWEKLLEDTIHISDAIAKASAYRKYLADTIEALSTLTEVSSFNVVFEDTVWASDAIAKAVTLRESLFDAIELTSTLARISVLHLSLEDSITAVSELSDVTDFKKLLEDSVIVGDFLVIGPWRGIIMTLNLKSRRIELILPP